MFFFSRQRVAGPFVWNPPLPTSATQVITEDDGKKRGHFCLLTRINCATDPIIMTSGSQATVWQDNNIGMKNLWVIEPDVVFPLTFGFIKKVKKAYYIIDTSEIPQWIMLSLAIPKELLNNDLLKQYRIVRTNNITNMVHLCIPPKKKNLLSFEKKEKIIAHFSIKSKIWSFIRLLNLLLSIISQPKKRIATVHISQYADNKCIGGASFSVNITRI